MPTEEEMDAVADQYARLTESETPNGFYASSTVTGGAKTRYTVQEPSIFEGASIAVDEEHGYQIAQGVLAATKEARESGKAQARKEAQERFKSRGDFATIAQAYLLNHPDVDELARQILGPAE